LRAFAVSLSQNADKADDLVQETLVKAWDKHESFQPGTNLKAWLFTILRNEFYSQMRKRGREVQDSEGLMTARLAVHPAQHGQLDLKDFRAALERQLKSVIARSARSRAGSAAPAPGFRIYCRFPGRPISVPTPSPRR
jgi:RNA polymerase sigma factor (sigma-70 family)